MVANADETIYTYSANIPQRGHTADKTDRGDEVAESFSLLEMKKPHEIY